VCSQRTLTGETRAPIEWRLDAKDVERENQRQWLEEREAEWTQQEESEKGEDENEKGDDLHEHLGSVSSLDVAASQC
jgi:hypothetical protein